MIGLDNSEAFVDQASALQEQGHCEFMSVLDGATEPSTAIVPGDINRSRASFIQGDACNISSELGQFDAVLGANLLCRLNDPEGFLRQCSSLIRAEGVLVLASPYQWTEEYTPKVGYS